VLVRKIALVSVMVLVPNVLHLQAVILSTTCATPSVELQPVASALKSLLKTHVQLNLAIAANVFVTIVLPQETMARALVFLNILITLLLVLLLFSLVVLFLVKLCHVTLTLEIAISATLTTVNLVSTLLANVPEPLVDLLDKMEQELSLRFPPMELISVKELKEAV
jgi:hypothetical protein